MRTAQVRDCSSHSFAAVSTVQQRAEGVHTLNTVTANCRPAAVVLLQSGLVLLHTPMIVTTGLIANMPLTFVLPLLPVRPYGWQRWLPGRGCR